VRTAENSMNSTFPYKTKSGDQEGGDLLAGEKFIEEVRGISSRGGGRFALEPSTGTGRGGDQPGEGGGRTTRKESQLGAQVKEWVIPVLAHFLGGLR